MLEAIQYMSAAATGQDAARAIRALEQAFQDNANTRDTSALVEAFFAEDAQLLPPNTPPVVGKAAIREFWTSFLGSGVTEAELRTGEVSASGDLAHSVGAYGYTLNGIRHSGKYLVVYRRHTDGSYRAIADAFSDNA